MKKLISITSLALLIVLSAFGQATLTQTTLSQAIDSQVSQFNIASATGVSNANGTNYLTYLFVDKEVMGVQTVSSTTVLVQRGLQGTVQAAHANAAKVWVGPPIYFSSLGANDPSGACTTANLKVLPYVNITTGNVWTCGSSATAGTGVWTTFDAIASRKAVGAVISSTGSGITIAPTNPVFHVSGVGSIATITVPPACPSLSACILYIIPDGAFTTTNAGNVAIASTAVVDKVLIMVWDPVQAKWNPSY
jgi:hypothetical protein